MPRKHTITITGQGTVRNGEYVHSTRPFVEHQAQIDFDKVSSVEDGKIHILVKFCETDTPVETVFECRETKTQLEELLEGAPSGNSSEAEKSFDECKETTDVD